MFKNISENKPQKLGKGFSDQSYQGKRTTFAFSNPDWDISKDQKSHTHTQFQVSLFLVSDDEFAI